MMERETREKYRVRDKKKKRGEARRAGGGETLHEGIERNTRFFLFFFSIFSIYELF